MTYVISKPNIKKKCMYNPLPTLDRPWESISMEYMLGLPPTKQGNDYFFLVVDQFSKMMILVSYKKRITTEATANIFLKRVCVHFGFPQTILYDQYSHILNTFLFSLWSRLDTSSPNPPSSTPKQMAKPRL
jgi:hypothetical protein